jgi:CheY-like chemotaxis protein
MTERTGRRVLVVDDNYDSTETLSLLLQVKGHEAHIASDGEEALTVADRVQPDLVLLDLSLPKMDGYEVARLLRQRPYSAAMLLVAVTGWSGQDVKARAAEAGFDYHLLKPVDWEQLERILELANKPAAT